MTNSLGVVSSIEGDAAVSRRLTDRIVAPLSLRARTQER
jgi:hypothetical protein